MAVLIGIQRGDGDWDNFVLSRIPKTVAGSEDVLGRIVPDFCYVEGYDGIARDDALRIANTLRGISRERRRDAFLDIARDLRKCLQGGTLA